MQLLTELFARNGFLPHGYCFTWTPGLLWSMVAADALIAAAYFSIPLGIARFMRGRHGEPLRGVAWLFSAFILACGLTHVMDVWTIWQPDYALLALTKLATAGVSIATAVVLWPMIPGLRARPSVAQLQAAVQALEAEVGRRRSAEQHLQEVEQGLAVTLDSIGAGFIRTDVHGRVTRINDVAERITGWPQAQALGQPLWTVFEREGRPPDMLARNPLDVMRAQDTVLGDVHHVVAVARDGTRTVLEVQAAMNHGGDGQASGLTLLLRDMTRLNAAETEARRMAAIVESSTDAIISKTLDGRVTSWNGAAARLFGYSADEMLGQPVQRLLPADRRDEEMRILANLAHGQTMPAFDTLRLHRDGHLLEVQVTISPIRDATGRIVGGSKIARDLSIQRRAEAALREGEAARLQARQLEAENRQILEASRLKSLFLANMSHELRTPLNAVIGFADLLQMGAVPAGSPKHAEFLGHIGTSGRHLLQLINDVLDLSKVEAGKLDFCPEPVDLPRLVAEVCELLHTGVHDKRLTLTLDIDPALDDLLLDPARLKQVLFNYLSNAIKFTAEGGRIAVRARPEGLLQLRLEVADTGVGIAAADLPRLFVEFQQLDSGYSKQHQGTGLGLALTRRLVQAQGGTVGVRSTPGQGSVFHLVLPRRPAQAVPAGAPQLLVIEDDPQLRRQLLDALAQAGFEVDGVGTGDEAVRQARGQAYDGIALDLLLPDQRGLHALAHIRDRGRSHAAPVVGVSMPGQGGASAGFAIADVLSKPLRTHEVLAAMGRLAPPDGRRTRVVVVDDDPMALELMQMTLRLVGADVLCFGGGAQALAALDAARPDVLVLDLMMPEMDGFAVLDALQRNPAWRHLPVLVWTSMLLTDDEYAQLARSAQAVLAKGGGGVADMLAALQARRPPAAVDGLPT